MSGVGRQADPHSIARAMAGAPPDVRRLLRRYGLRPDKSLGQNFLIDPAALRKVVAAAELSPHDHVLEIGAGLGSLTYELAGQAGSVTAVEFDRRLVPALQESIGGLANVRVINDDILSLDLAAVMGRVSYRVVANIPYNITSILIRRLMEAPDPSHLVVLTIQREVAERIVSGPGDMSLLALSVQVYGRPRIQAWIPAEAFYPRPKVDSAILRIDADGKPRVAAELIEPLFRLAKAGFGQKRKKLVNALTSGLALERGEILEGFERAGISADCRPQELVLEAWERLAAVMRDSLS